MQGSEFWGTMALMISGFFAVASLALIVSKNSNTTGVISTSFTGFGNTLATAMSPVTGTSSSGWGIS